MIYIVLAISILYITLIISFIVGFDKVPFFNSKSNKAKTNFSIIIPFRNEAENLTELLTSLANLNYPKNQFEIILIDDESTDNSLSIVHKFGLSNLQIISNQKKTNAPKKNAISLGVSKAKYNWIVTTDADCKVPKNWLKILDSFFQQKESNMICGAVKFTIESTFLHQFQQLNLLSLIGSTIGSFGLHKPIMCNGANLAFKKEIFKQLKGYAGNDNISSGDDTFLLEKIWKYNSQKVHYLKSEEFIVQTKPEKSWADFFNQQLRWASKSSYYKNRFTQFVGINVFLMNLLSVILFITSFLQPYTLWFFATIILKLIFDYLLIWKTAKLTSTKLNLVNYISSAITYPFFSTFIVLSAPFKKFTWKNRTYKK